MQNKILNLFFSMADRHAARVIICVVVLTVLCGVCIPGLRISTSHSDLLPSKHPEQARYLEFLEEFGAIDNMVVVLEGDGDELKKAAECFAAEIASETDFVKSIFYRIDVDKIVAHAPLFFEEEWLRRGLDVVEKHPSLVETISDVQNLTSLLRLIDSGLRNNIPGLEIGEESAVPVMDGLGGFFLEWTKWISDPGRNQIHSLDLLAGNAEVPEILRSDGYLLSHDQKMLFLFVQPLSSSDEVSYLKPFRKALGDACDRCFKSDPTLKNKIHVAFTGLPAHVLTEVETIYTDVGRAGTISVFLVALILFMGFRSLRKVILAVVPLCCGMIITLGVIRMSIGHLNLISSSFLAVLFGIGIDFGIYLIRRVEEELGNGREKREAVRTAVTVAGKGVLTGGLTTCLAFYAVTLSDFIGFSELGLTAGTGILIVLVTTFCMLPALMLKIKIEPRVYDLTSRPIRIFGKKMHSKTGKAHYMVLWTICISTFLLCVCGVFAYGRLKFDFNALNLLPQDAQSTRYQLKMQDHSDFQMTFAAVTADDLSQLKALEARIEKLPTVSRIESLAKLIPENQDRKLQLIRQLNPMISPVVMQFQPSRVDSASYRGVLEDIYSRLEDIQELAFSSGKTKLVTTIENGFNEIDRIMENFEDDPAMALSRTQDFEKRVFADLLEAWEVLQQWRAVKPIDENFLGPELRSRFKSPKGRYVTYVFPRESIWDLDFLDRFVAQLKEISPGVTGYPLTHRVNARMAVSGLVEALVFALAIILILLFLDFKRLSWVFLTLIPLAVGMCCVQVVMLVLGQDYNYASIAGLPLLLGLGVVYGVHIVHRWMENPSMTAFVAVVTSGRGVAFAAFTTLSGLCSIIFARHKGVSTFGMVLLMGIISCLIAALLVLPALIDLVNSKNLEEKKHEEKP